MRCFGLYIFLPLLLLSAGGTAVAQNPLASPGREAELQDKFGRYSQFTMAQGLCNNSVNAIAQDEDGFMWFGTEEGLSRFDGERFTSFYDRPGAVGKGCLPSTGISCLLNLPGHRLLIGTAKGLCVLNTRQLSFEAAVLPTRPEYADGDLLVWTLLRDRQGFIWVGTGTGVHRLDKDLRVVDSYFTPQEAGQPSYNYFARVFLELPEGQVAVKCNFRSKVSLWQIIDFQHKKTTDLCRLFPEYGVLDSTSGAYNVLVDGDRGLWLTSMGHHSPEVLYHFDWATRNLQPKLYSPYPKATSYLGEFTRPFLLPDSLLLLSPYFGKLVVYDLRSAELTEVGPWSISVPDGKGVTTFLDKDQNLWLCPRFEGIFFLSLRTPPARPLTPVNDAHKELIRKKSVAEEWFGFTCCTFAGKWFLGTSTGGFYSLDQNTGKTTTIYDKQLKFKGLGYLSHIVPGRGDTLWINTLDGLLWLKASNMRFGFLREAVHGLDSLDNKFLFRDHFGLIWGRVRNNGVCCYDTRNGHFRHFPSQGASAPFPLISASAMTEDARGDLWFSYGIEKKYLVKWTRQTGVFEKIAPRNTTDQNCTASQFMLGDPWGNLWVQTEDGTFVMNINTLETHSFGRAEGLVTDHVNGFTYDPGGNMWFATPYGLTRYNVGSRQIRTFYAADGLLSSSISNVELLDTARNILLVSTQKGLCLLEPGKIDAAAPAPQTFITGLWVTESAESWPETGRLELPYYRNTLRIEFTGIRFPDGNSNRYQYRLDDADDNWREAGTDNFANYLNLSPGKYRFRVRSANSDGVWGDQEAILALTIYPPFWQTWAFRIALLIALAALAVGLYQRQIQQVRRRETEKNAVRQQLADLEMKALRSQMNPHFVFNALNSVQNFILKNDTREASRYLTKFARLMRLILENSESPMVPLAREIELLRYYTELESLRFNQRFAFHFQIDPALNPESVSIPGMLIQPHIENAIWHGLMHKTTPGNLWVRFLKADDRTLLCEIEDDGVGRTRAAEIDRTQQRDHRSTGLANIRHRLELLNAQLAEDIRLDILDLQDAAGEPSGTKVVVRMPLVG